MTVVTVATVEEAKGEIVLGPGDVITPLARDRAQELGVRITRSRGTAPASGMPVKAASSFARQIPPAGKGAARRAPLLQRPPPPDREPPSGSLHRRGKPLPAAVRETLPYAAKPRTTESPLRVAVVGAGHVGGMTALRLAESNIYSSVVLTDVVSGLPQGLALDMWHSAALRRFNTRIEGTNDIAGIANAEILVVTAGRARQPGMSRADLTGVNGEIIKNVANAIRTHAPRAIVVVVTNPVEEMTHLMTMHTGFAPERVVGMAGVLDTARFCSLVGLTGVAKPEDVHALALGSHGPEMVIPLSQATANGVPLENLLDASTLSAIVERTRDSGAEVVKLLEKGSAYFAPAESVAAMAKAIALDTKEVMAACVQSKGVYGLVDTRVGLPARLGRSGVLEIVRVEMRPEELRALREAAERIAGRIRELG